MRNILMELKPLFMFLFLKGHLRMFRNDIRDFLF